MKSGFYRPDSEQAKRFIEQTDKAAKSAESETPELKKTPVGDFGVNIGTQEGTKNPRQQESKPRRKNYPAERKPAIQINIQEIDKACSYIAEQILTEKDKIITLSSLYDIVARTFPELDIKNETVKRLLKTRLPRFGVSRKEKDELIKQPYYENSNRH
ncbi:MAG: hypothetical protein HY918_01360 [Candidatus Doudnabacteria bacterium]|nr:hypothetical protein [Candidatus Doudnabacteria bacterium]